VESEGYPMLAKVSMDRIRDKFVQLFKLYVLRDAFSWNIKKWFAIRGDETLRLDYILDKSSLVFDVGGYIGDYAESINKKFNCQVHVFEPVPVFYSQCVARFLHNPSIQVHNYGLSGASGWFEIVLNSNESSFHRVDQPGTKERAELRSIVEVVAELGIDKIDLLKVNIEGGEFDLLPEIVRSGLVRKIRYIQIQFHNFDADAPAARSRIRDDLSATHRQMWNFDFVWESWELN
jgi:FkbM family methyltransferase